MKKLFILLALALSAVNAASYNDHRGINMDSLERVVARWTPDMVDRASEAELLQLNQDYRALMLGWQNLNGEKCMFYARKALEISVPRGWEAANNDAYRYVGQMFYGREQYDSAMVYYRKALESVDRMANGATSPLSPDGYSEKEVDDFRSSLYGTLGNLCFETDDIPGGMEYYAKAGEIFDKYGWNESNTVLWYNTGEVWTDEGELGKAAKAYEKAASYARASGDSLMIVMAYKGLGRLYMEKGCSAKALRYMREVNAYYAAHPDDSPVFRTETLEFTDALLSRQKKQLAWIAAGCGLIILLMAGFWVALSRLRKSRKEKAEASELIEETLKEIHPQEGAPELSAREKEVLDLLSKGYTAPMIAKALGLSPETIRWYRQKLLVKLDVSNTAELISITKEMGII